MPIPFIIAGVAAIAGAYGAKKGVDGYKDSKEAGRVNESAQYIYDQAQLSLNKNRESTDRSIKALGESKMKIYTGSLTKFVELFKQLKNTRQLEYDLNLEKRSTDERFDFKSLSTAVFEITSILGTSIASVGAGAAAGFGAFGGAGMLAAASTGTAISSLSGIAATNATLAWFGGGSLAAGGLGMAGGTMILGGIVAGPVLAVAGSIFAAKAETAKNNAYSNLEKAKAAVTEMKAAETIISAIKLRADEMVKILDFLNSHLTVYNGQFNSMLKINNNYEKYPDYQKDFVKTYCELAKTLKTVCDAPILDKEGKITEKSKQVLATAQMLRKKLDEI